MKKKIKQFIRGTLMDTKVKVALISGIFNVIGIVAGAIVGNFFGEKNAMQQLYIQITAIDGIDNTVTINSIDDFINQYIKVINENESLKTQISQCLEGYTKQNNKSGNIETQVIESPIVEYKNIGLCVDGEDIPINQENSIVTIGGREYYSKELAEGFLDNGESIIIENETLFIGKVVSTKENLFEQWIIDSKDYSAETIANDSYGNTYSNVVILSGYDYITYNLDNKFEKLKLNISPSEHIDRHTCVITIKADNKTIYTSPQIDILTETIDVDISIDSCKVLTIENDSSSCYADCIISNAIVYNE